MRRDLSANSVSATRLAIRRHFDQLYSAGDSNLETALQALLPPSLANPRIVSLRSSAFLTIPSWNRLLAHAKGATQLRQGRETSARILDVGCGRGRVGRALAAYIGASLTGIDFAETAITTAHSDDDASDAEFVVGDALDMPFGDASFDLVFAIDTLHLLGDLLPALREVRRVLADGGVFIGSAYRLAAALSEERSLAAWQNAFAHAGFSKQQWLDVTDEWRTAMTEKHGRRWEHRGYLVDTFGDRAILECDVSRQMLGVGGDAGFICRNERWEFCATR